ncbi:MAG: thioredoxin [Planctomycetota bacterium]
MQEFIDMAMELTDNNFETEVLNAEQPVLVDFWAEWCQPCRMLASTIDELAGDYDGKAKVGKLDTDANREVPSKYGISAIPTVMIFKDGQVAKKFVGLTPKDQFQQALDELI